MKTKELIHITTIDNPFDPFEDFTSWYDYDTEKGYYSCNKIARLINIEDEMSEQEKDEELERAINRLIEIDPLDIYTKFVKTVADKDRGEGS